MARKLRIQYPGAIYHVMNRGDRRDPIFADGQDRQRFLATLTEACQKTGWQVQGEGQTVEKAGASNEIDLFLRSDPIGLRSPRPEDREVYAGLSTNSFSYTPAGDVATLTDGKSQVTTWHYEQYGRATNNLDAASAEIFRWSFDANSRLTNRWTPEKGNTSYAYDSLGNLTNIGYSASAVGYSYDALGHLTNMVDGVGTNNYTYSAAGLLESEDGPWANDTVTYAYQNRLRSTLSLAQPNASPWTQSYGYDAAKRLSSVTTTAGSFAYAYDPVRHARVGAVTLPGGAYITNVFDSVSRLLSTVLNNSSGTALDAAAYTYNAASQRTYLTRTDGSYVGYTYDGMSQLKTAVGTEPGGVTNRLHEQFGYAYDPAGNLNYRTNNVLLQQFSVNNLNELTTVGRSGTLTVAGTTTSPATNVTVNGQTATRYSDSTFAKDGFTLTDGTNTFTAIARDNYGRADTNSSISYLPSSISFAYDSNGNLTNDGRRSFSYDDENQLVSVIVTNGPSDCTRSDFVYDGQMRRRTRREYVWQFGTWNLKSEVHYVYDGNLPIQERDANNLPLVTYTRGLDLSGSLQGAGGIGGLLARYDHAAQTPQYSTSFYHADGSGNITCLVGTNQLVLAKYVYDPYGATLAISGPLAQFNSYRFSSKEWHANSGTVYYGRRFYDPSLQRWLSRDPVAEQGGPNLYEFVGNDPLGRADSLGLQGNPIMGLGGAWNNNAFGPSGAFYGPGYLYTPPIPPAQSETSTLYGQGLNNTLSGIGEGIGRFLYDATPWMRCAFNISTAAAANAAFAGTWAALGGPTMDIGWAPTLNGTHFLWGVNTAEGTTALHVGGGVLGGTTSTFNVSAYAGYLSGDTAVTGIPIFFPAAAAAEGLPAYNCLTGACGALRRGWMGF